MMHYLARGAIVVLTVCVILSLLALAGGMRILDSWSDDEVTLAESLQRIISLTDTTVAAAARGLEVTPDPGNGSVEGARRLRNNYSLEDQSVSVEGNWDPAGDAIYNDCDSWRNLFDDGWSTSYHVTIKLRSAKDGDALLGNVRALWEAKGYRVYERVYESTHRGGSATMSNPSVGNVGALGQVVEHPTVLTAVYIDPRDEDGAISYYSLEVDKKFKEATLGGSTGCLSPGNR